MGTTALSVLQTRLQASLGDTNLVYGYNYTEALNDAVRETYPLLYKPLDDLSLITGNILPNAHFKDWASSSYPDNYTVTNAAAVATTTAGLFRGDTKSAKVTASAAGGYMSISSNDYPRLLDLMGTTVDFKCWAYPEVADDASIVIYTLQADATAQTLTSTTSNPAAAFTLLKLEDQELNDDLVEIQLRFKVTTNAKYVYFDDARVIGRNILEYLLPTDFFNGNINEVHIQTSGYSDDPCDDLMPRKWESVFGCDVFVSGSDKYIKLPWLHTEKRRIRLKGMEPLETMTAATDTISLDGNKIGLLIAYAKFRVYEMEAGTVSSEDKKRYTDMADRAYRNYMLLRSNLSMKVTGQMLNVPVW